MQKTVTYLFLVALLFITKWSFLLANPEPIIQVEPLVRGNAPSVASEGLMVYMVFAAGDSILFRYSADKGKTFSTTYTTGIISKLASGGGRGPKIVIAGNKLIVAAADFAGNIHTYIKDKSGNTWQKGNQVND